MCDYLSMLGLKSIHVGKGAPDIDLSTHPSALENSWQSTQGPELVLVSTWPLTGITFIDSDAWWRQLSQPYFQIYAKCKPISSWLIGMISILLYNI